jgi:hypothetical protein
LCVVHLPRGMVTEVTERARRMRGR